MGPIYANATTSSGSTSFGLGCEPVVLGVLFYSWFWLFCVVCIIHLEGILQRYCDATTDSDDVCRRWIIFLVVFLSRAATLLLAVLPVTPVFLSLSLFSFLLNSVARSFVPFLYILWGVGSQR